MLSVDRVASSWVKMDLEFNPMYELPKKPKFDKDFIMLSEFSELVGPVPVCFIPDEGAKGAFNSNHFSVRIMSSDFQSGSGRLVAEDTQVIISEKQECAYAYVHYFSLNDNHARGYVRQYCLSYISSSPSKIVDNFEDILKQFSEVTSFLKASNHQVFERDMGHYLADLELTMKLLQEEGWTEPVKDANLLYSEFDFTKEDVPERDPVQVQLDIKETREILATIQHQLSKESTKEMLGELKRLRDLRKQKSRERSHSFPPEVQTKNVGGFTSYLPLSPDSATKLSLESLSISSSGSSEYEPQRVMTHLVHKFERRLRTLEELAPRACSVAMERLHEIHKFFSRSELALEIEREEAVLLDPRSSLLTIGRVPVLNMLQDYSPPATPSPPPDSVPFLYQTNHHRQYSLPMTSDLIHQATPYRISSMNTWGMPNRAGGNSVDYVDGEVKSGFDASFLDDKNGLKQFPLYIDSIYSPSRWRNSESFATDMPDYECTTVHLDTDSDTNLLSIRHEDDDGTSRASTTFATPETGLTPRSSDEEEGATVSSNRSTEATVVSQEGVLEGTSSANHVVNGRSSAAGFVGAEERGGEVQYLSVPGGSSHTGSLELSGDSSPYLRSESGSQCTLTESREGCKLAASGTQGQNSQEAGQTGSPTSHLNGEDMADGATTHLNGEDVSDGAAMSSQKSGYPTLPSHLLSINSTEPLGNTDIVTFDPHPNGHCGSSVGGAITPTPTQVGHKHVVKSQPVAVEHSGRTDGSVEEDMEERFSAGSGSGHYKESVWEGGVVRGQHAERGVVVVTPEAGASRLQQEGAGISINPVRRSPAASVGAAASSAGSSVVGGVRQSPVGSIGSAGVAGGVRQSPVGSIGSAGVAGGVRQSPVSSTGSAGIAGGVRQSPVGSIGSAGVAGGVRQSPMSSTGNAGIAGGSVAAGGVRQSPVGSIGTTSSNSDEIPLPLTSGMGKFLDGGSKEIDGGWVRKKMKAAGQPPSDLHIKMEQGSPDIYHTPVTNFGHPPHLKSQKYLPPPSYEATHQHTRTKEAPLQHTHTNISASITSLETVFSQGDRSYRGPTVVEGRGQAKLPLVSTVDHIEGQFKFKPGKGIINFCKNTPVMMDLLYCLLQGRPLILLGKPAEENMIRRLIRVLWLFVPGHSSQRQVITWQETPLDIRDLSRVKLMGLCSKSTQPIGPHIKPYVSYWDCSSGKMWTPSYNGELLKPMVTRTKDKKNEEVFLTHVHSVLLEMAMKAFVYYHGYCVATNRVRRHTHFESSARKYHTIMSDKAEAKKQKMAFLQKLGVKNSDLDIIEYFVEVVKEQQLIELGLEGTNGSPQDENPVCIHLQTKHCADSFCKPKRPY